MSDDEIRVYALWHKAEKRYLTQNDINKHDIIRKNPSIKTYAAQHIAYNEGQRYLKLPRDNGLDPYLRDKNGRIKRRKTSYQNHAPVRNPEYHEYTPEERITMFQEHLEIHAFIIEEYEKVL